ncbi:MAG TPA: hypothetical protein VGN42_11385 [Pirellulales bacterium]|jgi:hypothetical protein|nr:hypothetical protein [Pirellulales bacterium]
MIVYKAMYKFVDVENQVHGMVLDFPGVITCGPDLNATRSLLASALADMAETFLLSGKALPRPDPAVMNPESDIEEPIYLLLTAANQVAIVPQPVVAVAQPVQP